MTTAIATDTMRDAQAAQDEITGLQRQKEQSEQDSAALSLRIAEILRQSAELKVQFSRGNAAAGVTLGELDRELVEVGHRRDGFKRGLAEAADLERQDFEVATFTKMSQQRADAIISQWRGACRDAYELMWMVEQGITSGRNLDETHRSQILSRLEALNNRFVKESTAVVNENWKFCRADQFRTLTIVPARKAG